VVLSLIFLDIFLLWEGKLSGTDFVLFFTVSMAVGFAIWFHGKIKELSFGGYVLKMKEENDRAEELIKQLEVVAQDSFKVHMSRFSSMHDSSPDHALHEGKAFVSCYEMYMKYSKPLSDEAEHELSLMIEAEIRKYLSQTALSSNSRILYGADSEPMPTPEDLVRKWGRDNNTLDTSPLYKFYKEKLYPLCVEHNVTRNA
jgi:hypothetical protein